MWFGFPVLIVDYICFYKNGLKLKKQYQKQILKYFIILPILEPESWVIVLVISNMLYLNLKTSE